MSDLTVILIYLWIDHMKRLFYTPCTIAHRLSTPQPFSSKIPVATPIVHRTGQVKRSGKLPKTRGKRIVG